MACQRLSSPRPVGENYKKKTNSFKFITLQWIMREGDGKRNLSKSTVKARLRKPIVCDKNGCKKTDLAERCNRDKVGE